MAMAVREINHPISAQAELVLREANAIFLATARGIAMQIGITHDWRVSDDGKGIIEIVPEVADVEKKI